MRPRCMAAAALNVMFARGWTLLELVVVIATLAILLAIALPSYQRYTLRVHRTEAIAVLLEIASCQERIFAVTGRYDTSRCMPDGLDHYSIRMVPPGETGSLAFIAWADPTGAQERDSCGSLGLDQTGLRKVTGTDARVNRCWRGRPP